MPSTRRRSIPEVVVFEFPLFEDGGGDCVDRIGTGSSSNQVSEREASRVASICPSDDNNQRRGDIIQE